MELWEKYEKAKTIDEKNKIKEDIIISTLPLVKIITSKMFNYFAGSVEFQDLESNAIMGLLDAIDKFDYTKGIKFETYASIRIRGSIIDGVREVDWVPRSIRQKAKDINKAELKLEQQKGAIYTKEDVAKELNISEQEIERWYTEVNMYTISSLDEVFNMDYTLKDMIMDDKRDSNPEDNLDDVIMTELLEKGLQTLGERDQQILNMYYYEGMSLKEVGLAVGISESRVSQLAARSVKKLRDYLESHGMTSNVK